VWLTLLLLILILDGVDLETIVVEQDSVLRVKTILEVVSVEDGLELLKELQRIFNTGDILKVLVDVSLKLSLNR
jgi:hypothetical protein